MPLYIKNDEVASLVAKLASLKGVSKQQAVRLAVQSELERIAAAIPLHERFAVLRAKNPMPAATGAVADKAFFDDLSGDL